MELSAYSGSQAFFEISMREGLQPSNSMKARWRCLSDFLKKIVILPFALGFKVFKTCLRSVGVLLAAAFLLATLGSSESGRTFFVERISELAKDLADWILLPFAIATCFFRLLLGFFVHPNLYFSF